VVIISNVSIGTGYHKWSDSPGCLSAKILVCTLLIEYYVQQARRACYALSLCAEQIRQAVLMCYSLQRRPYHQADAAHTPCRLCKQRTRTMRVDGVARQIVQMTHRNAKQTRTVRKEMSHEQHQAVVPLAMHPIRATHLANAPISSYQSSLLRSALPAS